MDKLTKKQDLFCYYVGSERATFGNATQSYAKAYGHALSGSDTALWRSCQASASRLLRSPKIAKRISEYLEVNGLTDASVDAQLLTLMNQNSNLSVKLSAIKEFNRLSQRITKRLEDMSNPEVQTALERFAALLPS